LFGNDRATAGPNPHSEVTKVTMIRSFGRAFVGAVAVVTALGCSPGPAAPGPGGAAGEPAPGAVRGELVVFTATFDDGRVEEQHFLHTGGEPGEDRRLLFATDPDLPSGVLIDVWGSSVADGLAVQRYARVPGTDIEGQQQALINGDKVKPRSFAFVLVDIGGGVPLTAQDATTRLFGTAVMNTPSVRQYYMEASYGRQDVAGAIFGPFTFTLNGCNTSNLASTLRAMIPGTYDHYLWYFGTRTSACGWSGLASGGMISRPARDTWYNGSTGCVVLVQEPGHNFGMRHSASMRCPGAVFADVPEGTCTHSEYGDSYDPMGRGCRHMNGAQKAYLGWFGKCNVLEVGTSGTYTLLPLELPCDGIQVLQIPMPKTRPFFRSGGGGSSGITELTHYFVELRAPHGIDRGLAPQVQIRVSADIRMSSQRAAHTWFLDQNPATTNLDGLVAGGSFTDPAGGVKITVTSVDAMKATVQVEMAAAPAGGNRCLDGTTLEAPGPGPESCAAAPASANGLPPPSIPDGGVTPTPGRDGGATGGRGAGGAGAGGSGAGGSGAGGAGPRPPDAGPPTEPQPGTGGSSSGNTGGAGGRTGTGGSSTGAGGNAGAPSGNEGGNQPPPIVNGCDCRLDATARDGGVPATAVVSTLAVALVLARRRRKPTA
jgi:MYXO-CTERM domain-containing protein